MKELRIMLWSPRKREKPRPRNKTHESPRELGEMLLGCGRSPREEKGLGEALSQTKLAVQNCN